MHSDVFHQRSLLHLNCAMQRLVTVLSYVTNISSVFLHSSRGTPRALGAALSSISHTPAHLSHKQSPCFNRENMKGLFKASSLTSPPPPVPPQSCVPIFVTVHPPGPHPKQARIRASTVSGSMPKWSFVGPTRTTLAPNLSVVSMPRRSPPLLGAVKQIRASAFIALLNPIPRVYDAEAQHNLVVAPAS